MAAQKENIMAVGKYISTYKDYTKESSSTQIYIPEIILGNILSVTGLINDYQAALDAITLGNNTRQQTVGVYADLGDAPAGSTSAQRENKWKVSYIDNATGDSHFFTIPTAMLTLLATNSDLMNIASGAGLAYVNALEAVAKSELGNDIAVTEIKFVGRNL